MNIVLLHYHLNAGGVTRVIENHLLALDAAIHDGQVNVLIVVGDGDNALPEDLADTLQHVSYHIRNLSLLSYDACLEPTVLADEVEGLLREESLRPDNCLLHIHNHALGKNIAWPQAVCHLAERGFHMLLQLHDFMEDFRPRNYSMSRALYADSSDEEFIRYLYPQAGHIHYCVLNHRDRNILAEAGLDVQRLHILPNPVSGAVNADSGPNAKAHWAACMGVDVPERLILYPVRGITRKNIGELLLHAAIAETGTAYALTLPPMNPIEIAQYGKWRRFAQNHTLPCYFGVGTVEGLGFIENIAAADAIITTSVAEGFGMVFLEPWLMGKVVIGRDLPDISADFKTNGIVYNGLYQRIGIPMGWIGETAYVHQWTHNYLFALHSYGKEAPTEQELRALALSTQVDETVDFALLTADLQRQVLRAVCADPEKQAYLREQLRGQMQIADNERISSNAALIQQQYSFACIGEQLLAYYHRIKQEPTTSLGVSTLRTPSAILDGFLDAKRFFPLRVAP